MVYPIKPKLIFFTDFITLQTEAYIYLLSLSSFLSLMCWKQLISSLDNLTVLFYWLDDYVVQKTTGKILSKWDVICMETYCELVLQKVTWKVFNYVIEENDCEDIRLWGPNSTIVESRKHAWQPQSQFRFICAKMLRSSICWGFEAVWKYTINFTLFYY